MAKKIFIISSIIFVIAGIFLIALKFMPGKTLEVAKEENEEQEKDATIQENQQKTTAVDILKIVEGDIKGATPDPKSGAILFFNDKNFLKADNEGGKRQSLATYPFKNVEKIFWSNAKDKAIVKDTDGFYIIYLDSNKTEKIKDGVDEAIFNTTGDKIIYKFYQASNQKRSVNISDLDGSNWQELTGTEYKEIGLLSQPGRNNFVYFPHPNGLVDSNLNFFDIESKKNEVIFSGKRGADYLWSPKGDKILVSFTMDNDKSKLSLGVMNASGGQFQGLNFPAAVKKCAWSKDGVNIYCAMTNSFPSAAILPDDWQNGKYFSIDTFWKINTESGKKDRVVDLEDLTEEIDSVNLFLDSDEKNLFFINKKNGDLYRIKL